MPSPTRVLRLVTAIVLASLLSLSLLGVPAFARDGGTPTDGTGGTDPGPPAMLPKPKTKADFQAQREASLRLFLCDQNARLIPKPKLRTRALTACHTVRPQPYAWTAGEASTFNYPYGTQQERYAIRSRVIQAIRGVPIGGKIRIATFSIADSGIVNALISAYKRGVSVQVLVDKKMIGISPPYYHLKRTLGVRLDGGKDKRWPLAKSSWVRTCNFSCRGHGGNLHAKIYLFSKVGRSKFVTMVGSANLTGTAAVAQWNHMNTLIGRPTYSQFLRLYGQMLLDRPQKHPLDVFRTKQVKVWAFPNPHQKLRTDPTVQALRSISCLTNSDAGEVIGPKALQRQRERNLKRALAAKKHQTQLLKQAKKAARAGKKKLAKKLRRQAAAIDTKVAPVLHRRTVIRISQYAWFDRRGNFLAKEVRRKWAQGCDIKIVYSENNQVVKRTLYSPKGRGRIPMRRLVVLGPMDDIVAYNHSKYLTVYGVAGGKPGWYIYTGSMNFTGLGVVSDDIIVLLRGQKTYDAYQANFARLWTTRFSVKPKP